jgi:two-component system, sensor histidine kinase and response regulator
VTLLLYPIPETGLSPHLSARLERKSRVLLIEDDLSIALMYQLQLVSDGYDVELATDGASGLRQLQASPPDLVLLDIRLPQMPGLDVLRAIGLDPRLSGVPVLILSNYGEPAMVREGLQLGARDYLIKSQTTPIQLSMRLRDFLPTETTH